MSDQKNPWKTISGELIYENEWIKLDEYQVINPSGGRGIYGKVSFKGRAVGILPIDDSLNTWLVGQYRYTLSEYSWEMPMGAVPKDETYKQGALRELKEETGLVASELEFLCKIHTSNSVTDEEGHVYVAKNLVEGKPEFDDTEDIAIKKLPFHEALNWVLEGKITDSLTVAGILKYARILGV
ncbi:NUDIX domain-containing protein [Roseivirga misakiensis]|uniref:GDP-mannose pyrophosphatase n=1 Tax=Roseivirga misakiensis TaxID=1563681 RepID=A0A1E5SKJ6_9BACT|nr:NUDIX hydrolase [Roseivirga misakiensis]OEJ99647.1 DNA mismatch repair protein MutT [Roseivirga misakiensis]